MASLQGIAESYAGKNLTAAQKAASVTSLIKDKAMESDFTVKDSKAIIVDALTRLGVDTKNLDIKVARPGDKNFDDVKANATASLRNVSRSDGTGGAAHWEQGDKNGNFVWDPISGTDEGGRLNYPDLTRYVIIMKKEE